MMLDTRRLDESVSVEAKSVSEEANVMMDESVSVKPNGMVDESVSVEPRRLKVEGGSMNPSGVLVENGRKEMRGMKAEDERVNPSGLMAGSSREETRRMKAEDGSVNPSGVLVENGRKEMRGMKAEDGSVNPSGLMAGSKRASKPRLVLDKITQSFQDGDSKLTILEDLSLEVGEGELVAVTGPSGSGKSTFLSIAGALLSPTSGEVKVDGQPLGGMSPAQLADLRLTKLGFIFQSAHLIPYLRVEEQLLLVAKLAGMPATQARKKAAELLENLGLASRKRYYPEKLSGGERQRAAVARAWMNDPSVLFADEPTASLDAARGRDVVVMLQEKIKAERKAGIMVTHDERVLKYCDRVLKLEDGRLLPA